MVDLKKERKSNKNLIFLYIKHDMEVENDTIMNSNQSSHPLFTNTLNMWMTRH